MATSETQGYTQEAVDCLRRNIAPETLRVIMDAAQEAVEEGDRGVQVVSDLESEEQYQLAVIESMTVAFECGGSGPQQVPLAEFKSLFGIE